MDFAFVDELGIDRRIEKDPVYDEVLDLCISQGLLKSFMGAEKTAKRSPDSPLVTRDRRFFEAIPYVDYQRDEAILRHWFQHHLGTQHLRLNVRATVVDVPGVARLVIGGLGAGVLSDHLIEKLQGEGHDIVSFSGSGKSLKNTISAAWLKDRSLTPAAAMLRDWLKEKLRGASGQRDRKSMRPRN
jgi:DNA-binding transcriptional LysR family regulator